MSSKILCVDDDANLLSGIRRTLRNQFSIDTALGGKEALRCLAEHGPFAVVVADMRMPQMSGLALLKEVKARAPETVRIMLTGNADQKTAMDAVNDGHVFRFLTKPCPPDLLATAIEAGLKQYRLIVAERELLENTLGGAVKVLTEVIALADPEAMERSDRLKEFVSGYAHASGLNDNWELEVAAMLSQIGRVTIPPLVLAKAHAGELLTGPESEIFIRVPQVGAQLLENIPRLERVAEIVRYQDKHFDGTGFPTDETAAQEIPVGARLLKILRDLVLLEVDGTTGPAAFLILQERSGWYDPEMLRSVRDVFAAAGIALQRRKARPIHVQKLRLGSILMQDVRTSEGVLIAGADSRLSQILIERLRNFQTLGTIGDTVLVIPAAAPETPE